MIAFFIALPHAHVIVPVHGKTEPPFGITNILPLVLDGAAIVDMPLLLVVFTVALC